MQENNFEQLLDKPLAEKVLNGLDATEAKTLLETYIKKQKEWLRNTHVTGLRLHQREICLADAQLQYKERFGEAGALTNEIFWT